MSNDLAREEGGAALIEATMVLPLLILLLFGFVDLALYGWQRVAAAKAVHLGLRRAVVSFPVARGSGLTGDADEAFYGGKPHGLRCRPASAGEPDPCPSFDVRCNVVSACTCSGERCGFTFAPENLVPILAAMRAVAPNIRAEDVEVGYRTNGLGYVGRPGPLPVDVTVRLIGLVYQPLFAGALFRVPITLAASATGPGEDLRGD